MTQQGSTTISEVNSVTAQPSSSASKYWWRQHLAACLVNLASLSTGTAIGWTAQALAVLRGEQPGSPLRLSLDESSWMTALVPVGSLVGALPAGLLAEYAGRKRALLGIMLPVVVGWVLILCAGEQVWMLYAGRFLTGLGVGAGVVLVSMYCEEIAEVRVRGTLGSYLDLMLCIGMLWVYLLGAFLPYAWYTASTLVPPIAFLLTFCWMPESPVFLTARGRVEEARRALVWLRGPNAKIQQELDGLSEVVKKPLDSKPRRTFFGCCSLPQLDRTTVKTMAIILGIMFFAQANGVNIFIYYTTDIFREADTNFSPEMATVILGIIHFIGTLLPTFTVDRVGRRLILAITGVSTGMCLLVMSVYSHLGVKGFDISQWRWVPLAAMITYMFMISAGPGPLTWFMMAELLPVSAKGWGSALSVAFSRLLVIIVVSQFPPMLADLGQDVTYAIFSVMCFLGVGYIYLCVPETKGKTREEIRMAISGKKENSKKGNDVC